jgi:hypothetical protein
MHKAGRIAEWGQGTMSDKSSALRAKSDDGRGRETASFMYRTSQAGH